MVADSSVQPSLLQGFPARQLPGGVALAEHLPVARVLVESPLPHLDRPFDYAVPVELDAAAQPGVRVKVKFNGQDLNGFLLERLAESDAGHTLVPLAKVVSPVPVLTPAVRDLASAVAARYAGTVSDVLRLAVPPRVARLEKDYPASLDSGPDSQRDGTQDEPQVEGGPGAPVPAVSPHSAWATYRTGGAFLRHLAGGGSPRAVINPLQGYGPGGWPHLLAQAAATAFAAGRGALLVVPDYRDLDRLQDALKTLVPEDAVARLTADDGPTPRYRNFLRLLAGRAKIAIGTRSAAFAPVQDLGLVACWDDGDDLHIEQRAPYAHAREVLLLRAGQEGTACLLAGHARSTEVQRLVEAGWAVPVEAERGVLRRTVPRVVNTADSFEQGRDPLATIARLPHAAWQAAKEGLERGPVLVQVARAGYAPSLVCETCREPARCGHCQGPLALAGTSALPQCRWCSTPAPDWKCSSCGGRRLRKGATGVLRTAEELGRAFPGTTVITSSGDQVKATVGAGEALVVATVGAEPVAAGGYAAALLLDGDSLLRRETLRAGEDTVRRWFNAASLVRPATDSGLVVVTATDMAATGALLRWDPAGYARRELQLRTELQLPPAVRIASVTGPRAAVEHFTGAVEADLAGSGITLRTAGPAPLLLTASPSSRRPAEDVRTLLFFPYAQAAAVVRVLRVTRAAVAAKRTMDPVQLRLDGVDVL
ncbi:primosomal protein N' [Arthrobacter sp. RC1.1 241]|jgi:primosomal protein N' (replication factor Y)|uniref:primosomal protein N' n=1 Tax=Paenarthrobacter sp. 22069 TaxID=3453864 RepID=UPI000D7D099D